MKMATRAERERQQRQNERHQELLGEMLLESRECADCGGRGPRWASWNLGVFVCIRCAGIHRKLGVHISKVKSVNLDQWTPEQIQCIREMGNLKAKILYEAHLPANFKRPQMDQAVESFIRDKYERKKYFDKSINIAEFRKENNKWKKEGEAKETKTAPVIFEKVKVPPKKDEQQVKTSPSTPAGPVIDLLGLDAPAAAPISNGTTSVNTAPAGDLDLFGPMVSNPLPDSSPFPPTQVLASTPQEGAENLNLFAEPSVKQEDSGKKQLSKDSILSLYGSQTQVPPQGTMFMASAQVPYAPCLPSGYTNFPPVGSAVTPAGGMLSNVGQSMGMMAPVAIPGGYVGGVQARVMGMPSGVMAQQGAYMGGLAMPQPVYGVQQAQQLQWNITQMTQQMAGMNFYGANGMVNYGQSSVPMGAGAAPAAGQSLGTQMWK